MPKSMIKRNHGHADGSACDCGCDKFGGFTMQANLAGLVRYELFGGKRTLVVPVIMAKADIVMNGMLVPESEMFSPSWNGVPVTVRHPETKDGSANSPKTVETYGVGTIFNSSNDAGVLRAEAWIDVEKANAVYPGLVQKLENGDPMDVSTGYFSKEAEESGTINGQAYTAISYDLKPDHLALLPDETGACSWDDGCGVRANNHQEKPSMTDRVRGLLGRNKKTSAEAFAAALAGLTKTNARGDANNPVQMVCDLVSNDASPFTPDDFYSLQNLSTDTLTSMRNDYLGDPDGDDDMTTNSATIEGGTSVPDDPKNAANGMPKTLAELNELIINAVKESVGSVVTAALAPVTAAITANALSDTDKAALAMANKSAVDHRAALVAKVVVNSTMTKEIAETFSTPQLEVMVSTYKPVANYGARPVPMFEETAEDDPAIKAMTPVSTGELIRNRAKAAAANVKVN